MTLDTIHALRRAGRHDEAYAVAAQLAAQSPHDAQVQYETACLCDYLGREADAVPHYVAALRGELAPDDRRSAYVGLGSTYRTLGRYNEAKATLLEGLQQFPEAADLQVFLAMALHNVGEGKQAVQLLLRLLAATSADAAIQDYRRAIELYAEDIDRIW
jgi:tetratricopeptide (TPR) repeat protein